MEVDLSVWLGSDLERWAAGHLVKARHQEHVVLWCYTSLRLSQQDSLPEPLSRTQSRPLFRTSPPQYHTVCHQWEPCCMQRQERGSTRFWPGTARVPIILNAPPNMFVCDNRRGKASGNQAPYHCCAACHITKPGRDKLTSFSKQLCCVSCCLLQGNWLFTSKANQKANQKRMDDGWMVLPVQVRPVAQEQAARHDMHWWNNRSVYQVAIHHPVQCTRKSGRNPSQLYWPVCRIQGSTKCLLVKSYNQCTANKQISDQINK